MPFQRYAISAEDGSPVLINPYLFALALRMPLKDCIQLKIRCGPWGESGSGWRECKGKGGRWGACWWHAGAQAGVQSACSPVAPKTHSRDDI